MLNKIKCYKEFSYKGSKFCNDNWFPVHKVTNLFSGSSIGFITSRKYFFVESNQKTDSKKEKVLFYNVDQTFLL